MGLPDYSQNPFMVGSQNYRLLERLRIGPVSNAEIVHKLRMLKYTGRLSEIRRKGFNVLATKVADKRGVFIYQLVQR